MKIDKELKSAILKCDYYVKSVVNSVAEAVTDPVKPVLAVLESLSLLGGF